MRIIDGTLREGMQTPSGYWSTPDSVEVAELLRSVPVDMIECGHPSRGPEEVERVSEVVKAANGVPVLAHARADLEDIDAVAKTGAAWVGVFIGVNTISRTARLPGRSGQQLRDLISESVSHARDLGLEVRLTVEDGGRTDTTELMAAFRAGLAAGAHRICVADTVGSLEPSDIGRIVALARRSFPEAEIEAHLHDDRGLALANALAAVDAGATWVSTSVNGLGERSGVVDLAAFCANLHLRGMWDIENGPALVRLSRLVGARSRSHPDARRPVVGAHAFHHSADLHVKATERDSSTYECLAPEIFGLSRSVGMRDRWSPRDLVVKPEVISATELRHHRAGPGDRYVLVDDRFLPGAGQYCIARRIPELDDYGAGHVDVHRHSCDSLFVFLGDGADYRGLAVMVQLGDESLRLESPASVFIPAAMPHGYRVLSGAGTYLNHVLAGDYNSSLLE